MPIGGGLEQGGLRLEQFQAGGEQLSSDSLPGGLAFLQLSQLLAPELDLALPGGRDGALPLTGGDGGPDFRGDLPLPRLQDRFHEGPSALLPQSRSLAQLRQEGLKG